MDSKKKAVWAAVAVVLVVLGIGGFFGIRHENRQSAEQSRVLTQQCETSARQQSYSNVPSTRNVETKDLVVTGEVSEGTTWYPFTCDGSAVAKLTR
jgi:uncharacterized protein HemX